MVSNIVLTPNAGLAVLLSRSGQDQCKTVVPGIWCQQVAPATAARDAGLSAQ